MFLKPALLEKIHGRANGSLISDIVLRVGEIPVEAMASGSHEHGPAIHSAPSTEHLSFATASQARSKIRISKGSSFKLLPSHCPSVNAHHLPLTLNRN